MKSIWISVTIILAMAPTARAIPSKAQIEQPATQAEMLVQRPTPTPSPPSPPTFELEEITVTGTRTPRTLGDSPASISIQESQDLQRTLVQDLQDLVRYEPGVSVRGDLRFGIQDFNIRGLDANRVLIQVDGIRQPERFEFGPFNLGRDYFELETLRRLEIVRGPASSLYGSDALGGVVTFTTLDPSDLLAKTGRDHAFELRSQYNSRNDSVALTLGMAGRQEQLEGLLLYTRRDFRQTQIRGDASLNNRQQGSGDNVLGKLVYQIDPQSSLKLTGELFRRSTLTDTSAANLGAGILSVAEDVVTRRERISLEYSYDNPQGSFFQAANAQIYYQSARISESGPDTRRLRDGSLVRRDNSNKLSSDIFGGDLRFQSNFTTGEIRHRLLYGLDVSSSRNARPRNRIQTNLTTGAVTQVIPPDTFPTKDFPDSDTLRFGAYIQNEIELNTVTLIPGLRYDLYDLRVRPDFFFLRSGSTASDLSTSALSPKLGFVWRLNAELTLVGQYAAGFRAPQYNEINSGFTNLISPTFRYRTLSNPNLKPETSNSFELGLRGIYPNASFSLTGYFNTYDNFIEAFSAAGTEPSPDGGPPVNLFQSRNVSRARIYGFEAKGEYRFGQTIEGFSLNASLSYAVGDDLTRNRPLATVDPFKTVVGLRYRAAADRWGAELVTTLVGVPRVQPREGTPGQPPPIPFIPGSYTVVDLLGYYRFSPNDTVNIGIFNLFNTRYFQYSEVRFLNQGPGIERFSQPGTNAAINYVTTF